MKTKLTLSVEKRVVDSAKRLARRSKTSVSKLFEEMFDSEEQSPIKTPEQIAAKELLDVVGTEYPIHKGSDKQLIKKHIAKKYS